MTDEEIAAAMARALAWPHEALSDDVLRLANELLELRTSMKEKTHG